MPFAETGSMTNVKPPDDQRANVRRYDVVMLGGGLSGLSLARQLNLENPEISILVIEKRRDPAPIARYKVGESIVELGSYYLRATLDLKDHLEKHHLQKLGFRFFLSAFDNDEIATRVEVGAKIPNPVPAYHIDRGIFENHLSEILVNDKVNFATDSTIKSVDINKAGHRIRYVQGTKETICTAKWLIDASGRQGIIKRSLSLQQALDHPIASAWFRLEYKIDIEDWSDDSHWKSLLGPDRRRLATNHLMGKGYWVWLIPLSSGFTSVGIVADTRFHSFEQYNTVVRAMEWLHRNEPLAHSMLSKYSHSIQDFRAIKNIAHDCSQWYSDDRWGITGDAGTFIDPLYSPGVDFIALSNTWLSDLIKRDLRGEDISIRTKIYAHVHRTMINGWTSLYRNMYSLFGNTQIMLLKIIWDWASYWSVPCPMFVNEGYTDLNVLIKFSSRKTSIGLRFSELNRRMQTLFLSWSELEKTQLSDLYIDVFNIKFLYQMHMQLDAQHEKKALVGVIEGNLLVLEKIVAEIFRRISTRILGTDPDMKVNPYKISLNEGNELPAHESNCPGAIPVDNLIRDDISKIWFVNKSIKSPEYVK